MPFLRKVVWDVEICGTSFAGCTDKRWAIQGEVKRVFAATESESRVTNKSRDFSSSECGASRNEYSEDAQREARPDTSPQHIQQRDHETRSLHPDYIYLPFTRL